VRAIHTKNYVAFAEAIKEEIRKVQEANEADMEYEINAGQLLGIETMARRTAEIFRKDNERFNVDQFLAASGIKSDHKLKKEN
jgi:hypothetical protein